MEETNYGMVESQASINLVDELTDEKEVLEAFGRPSNHMGETNDFPGLKQHSDPEPKHSDGYNDKPGAK